MRARRPEFLAEVAKFQSLGFTGMFTCERYRLRDAETLRAEGLLRAVVMDVADGDGFIRQGCAPRQGYALTRAGLDAIPEDERPVGLVVGEGACDRG